MRTYRKYIAILFALSFVQLFDVGPSIAQSRCDSILKGLVTHDTQIEAESFQQLYIRFLRSSELRSLNSTKETSGKAGIKFPEELQIPVEFNQRFLYRKDSSRVWSKEFANYLEVHQAFKRKFFRELKKVNGDIVKIWLECKKLTRQHG